MRNFQIAGACCGLLLGSPAFAEDPGPYVGLGAGVSHEGFEGFRAEDIAIKAFGGYSFNRYFAAELEYVDAGTLEDDIEGTAIAITNSGFIASFLAKWPVTDVFSPYLKLGYAFYDTDITVTNGAARFSDSLSESDLMFGGGVEFKLGDQFRVRAEMEKVKVPDADFRVYTLNAAYHF